MAFCRSFNGHSLALNPFENHSLANRTPRNGHSMLTQWPFAGYSLPVRWPIADHSLTIRWPFNSEWPRNGNLTAAR
eukprot:11204482-Lingulodinium_polyedra.AAC.1